MNIAPDGIAVRGRSFITARLKEFLKFLRES